MGWIIIFNCFNTKLVHQSRKQFQNKKEIMTLTLSSPIFLYHRFQLPEHKLVTGIQPLGNVLLQGVHGHGVRQISVLHYWDLGKLVLQTRTQLVYFYHFGYVHVDIKQSPSWTLWTQNTSTSQKWIYSTACWIIVISFIRVENNFKRKKKLWHWL